jgi:hypothetical protein
MKTSDGVEVKRHTFLTFTYINMYTLNGKEWSLSCSGGLVKIIIIIIIIRVNESRRMR